MVVFGAAANVPPSILYSMLNPATAVTVGKANADAQVLAGAVITGAAGKTTTFTRLLIMHGPVVRTVPGPLVPQAAVVLYLASTV